MIKLSTMTSVVPDWTIDEIIERLPGLGYQGLEPRVQWDHASKIEADLSKSERTEVRERLEGAGIAVSCVATGVRMAATEPAERKRHTEDAKRYIELAHDLGAPYLRTFGGPRDSDWQPLALVEWAAEGYREILPQARAAGVTVLMETHDDWSSSAPVRAVVEKVGDEHLAVLWDLMHPQRMCERPDETFRIIGGHTRHLHAHDAVIVKKQNQEAPVGEGLFDHATPLKLLANAGFDGHFSVEVIRKPGAGSDPIPVLRQYAEFFAANNPG